MRTPELLFTVLLTGGAAFAQTAALKQIVGTVTEFQAATAEVTVRPDTGDTVRVRVVPTTIFQRVAPGEKDLKKAGPCTIGDIAVGDRVLVTMQEGTEARRIIVMPASDIARKQEADKQEWIRRGVNGVVTSKSDMSITLRARTMRGENTITVQVDSNTKFHRYAPDSVRFADAQASQLAEVKTGDQLRARGRKDEAGTHVDAEEIVFGSFITRGGTITAVDPLANAVTFKDLASKKPVTIQLTADTQLKSMPQMDANPMMGRFGGPLTGGGFDLNQMLERMPATHLADLKPGTTIVVSSTKGARADQMTAIMLVANADALIQMAQRSSQAKNSDPGISLSGGGFGGLDLSGMMN